MRILGTALAFPALLWVCVVYVPGPALDAMKPQEAQAQQPRAQEKEGLQVSDLAAQIQAIKEREIAEAERKLGDRFRNLIDQIGGQESPEKKPPQDTIPRKPERETTGANPSQRQAPKGQSPEDPWQNELPVLKLPESIEGEPGEFIAVRPDTNGGVVEWVTLDKGLSVFPGDMLRDPTTTVVTSRSNGTYRLLGYTAVNDTPSKPAIVKIIVGTGENPAPGPGPGPNPPPVDGFGLAEKVKELWIKTVPEPAQKNAPAIRKALLDSAATASKFDEIADMKAAALVLLSAAITDKAAWATFGNQFVAAVDDLILTGKIVTPVDLGKAFTEVGEAL